MEQSLYDYVMGKLEASRGNWPEISTAADVPYQTLTKIAQRRTKNPGVQHIQKLADHFRRSEAAA